ncbi:hypothetical protein ES319_A07G242300v1 [Gossypium barbadense]|uniref:Uncharacterized protein n=3 Tax=Gossypium TaxID=3633 RepID=A0A5J5V8M1_GOSBA|nr:hypothetical protein ES319_A07G242300v1 [Gossypium barbadense]
MNHMSLPCQLPGSDTIDLCLKNLSFEKKKKCLYKIVKNKKSSKKFLLLFFHSKFQFQPKERLGKPKKEMAMVTVANLVSYQKSHEFHVICRRREKGRENQSNYPYKVIEITPPPKSLGVRCFPPNLQCGESVTIEGQTYTISAVTHRYQLRKGKYEPSEKRLDVQSTGRYILNLYLESLLEQS